MSKEVEKYANWFYRIRRNLALFLITTVIISLIISMTLFITLSNAWLWVIAGSIFLLAFLPYYFYLGYTFRTHSEALNSSVIKI